MTQVRSFPPPPPPQWLVAPQTCCFALFPSAPPLWSCTVPLRPPTPPAVVWCGVVVPAARPLLQQQRHQRHYHHIVNNWYPLKPAVLRGSVTPLLWCGAAGPPLPPPLWCGVVVPAARPLLQQSAAATWERCGTYSWRGGGRAARSAGGRGGIPLGGGGRRTRNRDHIYIYISLSLSLYSLPTFNKPPPNIKTAAPRNFAVSGPQLKVNEKHSGGPRIV